MTQGLYKFKKDMIWIFLTIMILASAVLGAGLGTLFGSLGIVMGMVFGFALGIASGAFIEKMEWSL